MRRLLLLLAVFCLPKTILTTQAQNEFYDIRVIGYSDNGFQCNGGDAFGTNPDPRFRVKFEGTGTEVLLGEDNAPCGFKALTTPEVLASVYVSNSVQLEFTIESWEEDFACNLDFDGNSYDNTAACRFIGAEDENRTVETQTLTVTTSNGQQEIILANGYTVTIAWGNVILPVKLTSFTGEESNQTVDLKWTTASEINNSHFEVERQDQYGEFVKIGEVQGAGDSTEEINYSFVDPAPQAGANRYRLRQVDFNLDFEYSDVIEVEVDFAGAKASFFPNPATNGQIKVTGVAEGKVQIFDLSGQIMVEQEVTNGQLVDIAELSRGFYILTITDKDGNMSQDKLVVQ